MVQIQNSDFNKYFKIITFVLLIALMPIVARADIISFLTDKTCYDISSAVTMTLTNNGAQVVTLSDTNPWEIYDSKNNLVYVPFANQQRVDVDLGNSVSWNWNQRNSNGLQVAAGSYKAVIPEHSLDPDDAEDEVAQFSIAADADEDCIADTADRCPYDFDNTCAAAKAGDKKEEGITIIRQIGGQTCVGETLWCFGDKDRDGAPDEQDGCPSLSGPEWNNHCPDYKYKEKVAKDFKAARDQATHTSLLVIWVPFANVGTAATQVITMKLALEDANEKIRKDPPDSNYKRIATLERRPVVLLSETSETNYLINKYLIAAVNYAAAADAFVRSNERLMGAELAGDEEWVKTQSQMTKFYALKTTNTLELLNEELAEFESFLIKTKSDGVITKLQLQQTQDNLKKKGIAALPPYEIEFAKNNILMSDAEINLLKDRILEIDSSSWEENTLTDKTKNLRNANNELAVSLKEYATVIGAAAAQGKTYKLNVSFVLVIILVLFLIWKFKKKILTF